MSIPDLREARALLERGDVQEAVQVLEALVALFPRYAAAHVLLARAYEAHQAWQRAVAAWQDAAVLVPGSQAIRTALQHAALTATQPPPPPTPEPEADLDFDEALEIAEAEPEVVEADVEVEPVEPEETPVEPEDMGWVEEDDAADEEPTIAGPFAGAEMPRAWFMESSWDVEEEEDEDASEAEAPDQPAAEASRAAEASDPSSEVAEPPTEEPSLAPSVPTFDDLVDRLSSQPPIDESDLDAEPEIEPAAEPLPPPPLIPHADVAPSGRRVSDFENLDRLIEELEEARIVPRPDVDAIPTPDLDDEIDDMVSETLARIYAAQEQFDEAARVYDALARQQPDRAAEFREQAARMRARHES